MKLKTTEVNGGTYALIDDKGNPIYVQDDGKEIGFDAPHAYNKITSLTRENKDRRTELDEAKTALAAFDGIEDPKAALAAIEKVAAFSEKDMVDAGKVEEIKAATEKAWKEKLDAATKAAETKLAEKDKEVGTLKGQLNSELIGGNFARSKWIGENVAIPPDMLEARFGSAFEVVDGKVVAKDSSGERVYSKARPGELAGFEEAIEILVEAYPQKDHILKGSGSNGSGSDGGKGGNRSLRMSNAEFQALPAKERAAKMAQPGFQLTG